MTQLVKGRQPKGEELKEEQMRELRLLEALEEGRGARQVDLAARVGVAVGTVNWLLKRLAAKGYVKIQRIGRWNWRYLLTPRGVAAKARLAQEYVRSSMRLYRETRRQVAQLLDEVKRQGYAQVRLEGEPENDLLDVCRLTCLERGIELVTNKQSVPVLWVVGSEVALEWPQGRGSAE